MIGWIKRTLTRPADFVIGSPSDPYLLRWYVIPRNRLFNVYLHKFLRDDDDRALHDHPWWSVSLTLKGCYVEHTASWVKLRRPGSIVFRTAKHAHRVALLRRDGEPQVAWTLFVTGPKVREWGFLCPSGWRHWRQFTAGTNGEVVGKGCDD